MARKRRIAETSVIVGLSLMGITAMAAADGDPAAPAAPAQAPITAPAEPAAAATEAPAAPAAPAQAADVPAPDPVAEAPTPEAPVPGRPAAEREAAPAPAPEEQAPERGPALAPEDRGAEKLTICHATGSATNPYVEIEIAINGMHGHEGHAGDIAPAPAEGCPATLPAPAEPKDKPGKITICHATGSEKNPYVRITISENGLNGHGEHEGDLIPAPAEGCPATAPAATGKPEGKAGDRPRNDGESRGQAKAEGQVKGHVDELPGRQAVLGEGDEAGAAPASSSRPAPVAVERGSSRDQLPFTGLDAWLIMLAGLGLAMSGSGLWLLTAQRDER